VYPVVHEATGFFTVGLLWAQNFNNKGNVHASNHGRINASARCS